MKVLMISGKSGHGKDKFASILKEKLESRGKTVLVIHFGDAVKNILRDYYNWDGQKNTEGRALLQRIGTTVMREAYPTYWAEIVAKFIAAAHEWDYVLIPDLRFINEYDTVCQYNDDVTIIRINRIVNNMPYHNPAMRNNQLTHVSECELDNFNFEYIIENNTLEELIQSADLLLDDLMN